MTDSGVDVGNKLNERWGALFGQAQLYIIQLEHEKAELIRQIEGLVQREAEQDEEIRQIEGELLSLKRAVTRGDKIK